jgi:hypothetical protein
MLALGFGSVLVAWSLSMQALAGPALDPQTDVRSREQTTALRQPPNAVVSEPQVTSSTLTHRPKDEAWQTLEMACAGKKTPERASATLVLGLLPNDTRARKLAEKALADPKPEMRSAGAADWAKWARGRAFLS